MALEVSAEGIDKYNWGLGFVVGKASREDCYRRIWKDRMCYFYMFTSVGQGTPRELVNKQKSEV